MTAQEYLQALRAQCAVEVRADMNPVERFFETDPLFNTPKIKAILNQFSNTVRDLHRKDLQEHYHISDIAEVPTHPVDKFAEEDPVWINTLSRLLTLLTDAMAKVGMPVLEKPTFGTLPIGTLNAQTLKVPGSQELLIVFNDGIFAFVNSLIKALMLCFFIVDEEKGLVMEIHGHNLVRPEAQVRFHDVLSAYVLLGNAEEARSWLLPASLVPRQFLFLQACEMFILCHEYGHIALEHQKSTDTTVVQMLWVESEIVMLTRSVIQEEQADAWGASMALLAIPDKGTMAYNFAGIEIYFRFMEMVERAISILRTGVEEGSANDSTHMSWGNRRNILRLRLIHEWGSDIQKVFGVADEIGALCDILWAQERDFFLRKHSEGVKPARLWNALM